MKFRRRIPPRVDYKKPRALDYSKMVPQRCMGFGAFEGQCADVVMSPSLHWCDRCEQLRRAHITARLESLVNR